MVMTRLRESDHVMPRSPPPQPIDQFAGVILDLSSPQPFYPSAVVQPPPLQHSGMFDEFGDLAALDLKDSKHQACGRPEQARDDGQTLSRATLQ
jgi:hypothetical protein